MDTRVLHMDMIKTYNSLQEIILDFLQTHFFIEDGLFEPADESSFIGNRRYGWTHYKIHNVEVALLLENINLRFTKAFEKAAKYGIVGADSCYVEIFAPNFSVNMVVVLEGQFRDSLIHPGTPIRKGTIARIEDLNFVGELGSAIAYFTFAKLAK
jgi:hypothetical protein